MNKSRLLGAVSACTFTLLSLTSSSAFALTYTLIDLGPNTMGYGINAAGEAAGEISSSAFLFDGTTVNDIGALNGGSGSVGRNINDSSQVVGTSRSNGNGPVHAFLYDGTMHDLGTLGGTRSRGIDINSSGQVAGRSQITGDSADHAFLYDGSTMHDLGTLGGTISVGNGINDAGYVSGHSQITGDSAFHAFLYDGSTMHDLGTLGGTNSFGYGVNSNGYVSGTSDIAGGEYPYDGTRHAFLYDGSTMHDLGALGGVNSFGLGLNDNGWVVGYNDIQTPTGGDVEFPEAAFLYDGNTMLDLCILTDCTVAGWDSLGRAYDINNNGDIVGYGTINGTEHAFIAVANVPPVPLPAGVWLLLSALGGLGLAGWRRKRLVAA